MNPRLVAIAAAVVVVLFTLKNTDGYYPWPTQVVPSEQANDDYLESLLKAAGYEGKYVTPPDVNKQESQRLNATLRASGYAEIPMTGEVRAVSMPFTADATKGTAAPVTKNYSYLIALFLFVALAGGVGLYVLLRSP
jgi:cytochrome c-type biogenesis protein CcmE